MKKLLMVAVLAVGAALLLTSCQKTSDEEAIRKLVAADTVWFNTNTQVDSTDGGSLAADTATAIIWWRGAQTHPEASIDIEVVGDSALVKWSRGNVGKLNIWADTGLAWTFWQKPLTETAKLNAIYRRTGSVSDSTRGWELKKISWAWGQSDSVHTVAIDSVRIASPVSYPNGFVVRDPLNTFYSLDSLVTFNTLEPVTVTLYTNAISGNAFVHSFILAWPFYARAPFTDLGGGVFQGTWNVQAIAFPRYAIFDLMHHATLYDHEASYDFMGWLIPYMLK